MQLSNSVIQWNVNFLRAVQDLEVEVVMAFFRKLYAFRSRMGGTDHMQWIPSERHIFRLGLFFACFLFRG
jgi:hypothetical protein